MGLKPHKVLRYTYICDLKLKTAFWELYGQNFGRFLSVAIFRLKNYCAIPQKIVDLAKISKIPILSHRILPKEKLCQAESKTDKRFSKY